MKKVLLLVLVAGGSWWYFQGGRVMTEQSIDDFYQQQTVATLNRNPAALCDQLAPEYQSSAVLSSREDRVRQEANKEQSCKALAEMYATFEKLGEKMDGILQLDYDHRIQKITISSDKKTAVVETAFSLDVAGSIINLKGASTDTLTRRNGRVMILRSESRTSSS